MYADNLYSMPDNHQQKQHDDDVNINHVKIRPTVNCKICQQLFPSNNALHWHLCSTCQALKQFEDPKKAKLATMLYAKPKKEVIIMSTAPKTNGLPRHEFHKWQYTMANIQFSKDQQAQVHNICLDTGCTMTLIDKDFPKKVTPDAVMKKMVSLVSVRGVGCRKHSSVDNTTIDMYFPQTKRRTAMINQEIHKVDSLKAKMLIGIDILGKESFTINTKNKKAIIKSCNNLIIFLEVASQAHTQFTQQILADKDTIILAKTLKQILVQSKLAKGKNLLFKPSYAKPNVIVVAQTVNCRMTKILMRNNTNNSLTIAGKTQLEQVIEYKTNVCY